MIQPYYYCALSEERYYNVQWSRHVLTIVNYNQNQT